MENSFEKLKLTREEQNLSLEDVSNKLLIRSKYLNAIESGNFSELPERVYAIGFIKNYANFLGLNASEFISEYKRIQTCANADTFNDEFIHNEQSLNQYSILETIKFFFEQYKSPIKRAIFICTIIATGYILIDVIRMFLA